MWILALVGCGMGSFTTADGAEPVRTALYFVPDSTVSLELYGARQAYVLLANSTLPCWPVDEDDDPDTPPTDNARSYWDAQFATVFAREGGRTVAFALSIDADADWLGRYSLHEDAWEAAAMGGYVATDGRVASGAWYEVIESAVDDGVGVSYALDGGIEVVEEAHDIAVGAPAWVEIARKDTALEGTFDFDPAPLSGGFTAERCDNLELLSDLYTYLAVLAIADGALEETDEAGGLPGTD
ncbi:MAG: hypothetical protein Q8P41_27485 [Pseudomonadota bacterium]|nr:hypothetical protein [Pseudomonadota bacterium]